MYIKKRFRLNSQQPQVGFIAKLLFRTIFCGSLLLSALSAVASPFAYVADLKSSSILVIDTAKIPNTIEDKIFVDDGVMDVAVAPDSKRIYVTNHIGVSIIDPATKNILDTVAVGGVTDMAMAPDGKRVYVTDSNGMSAIDTVNKTVLYQVALDGAKDIAVAPNGKRVYVTDSSGISIIDTTAENVEDTIALDNAGDVAVSPDGKRVYVVTPNNTLSVIDTTATPNVIKDTLDISSPFPQSKVAAAPDGKRVYVAGGGYLTRSAWGISISAIDTTTTPYKVEKASSLGENSSLRYIAVTPDSKLVYATMVGGQIQPPTPGNPPLPGRVSVFDTASNAIIDTVAVGSDPAGIAFTPKPTNKNQCKNNGWKAFGFKNQGQCVAYVERAQGK